MIARLLSLTNKNSFSLWAPNSSIQFQGVEKEKYIKPGMELRSNKIVENLRIPIPRQITEQELDDLYRLALAEK